MNAQKFTQKSMEAIQNAQSIALSAQNMHIEQLHLFQALIQQEGGLIGQLLQKLNINLNQLQNAVQTAINSIPAVTGSGRQPGQILISQDVDKALNQAEQQASKMKDEYVSVEHIFLALLEHPDNELKKILNQFHIDKNQFLQVLMQVRGNTRVTSENPEETYDVLKKYGQNLTDLAKTKQT